MHNVGMLEQKGGAGTTTLAGWAYRRFLWMGDYPESRVGRLAPPSVVSVDFTAAGARQRERRSEADRGGLAFMVL